MLTRSLDLAEKERAMRLRALDGLRKDLAKLGQRVRSGRVRRRELIYKRLGRLEERWSTAWPYLKEVELTDSDLVWSWDRKKLRSAWLHQGAYLLRTNLTDRDPQKLRQQYIQLTDVEAVFRTLKSELNLRTHLSPDPATRRSPYPHCLPRLLSLDLSETKVARSSWKFNSGPRSFNLLSRSSWSKSGSICAKVAEFACRASPN